MTDFYDLTERILALVGLGLLGLMVASLISAVAVSAREWAIWLRLKKSGTMVEASVEDLYTEQRGRGTRAYIKFQAIPEIIIPATQPVSAGCYERLKKRQSVTVLYLREHPAVARLAGDDEDRWGRRSFMILGIVICLVFWPLVILWLLVFALVYFVPQTSQWRVYTRITGE